MLKTQKNLYIWSTNQCKIRHISFQETCEKNARLAAMSVDAHLENYDFSTMNSNMLKYADDILILELAYTNYRSNFNLYENRCVTLFLRFCGKCYQL